MTNNGSAYERVTRVMVEDIKEDVSEIKTKITGLDNKMTDLFNHQSSRWPPQAAWALAVIGTILGGVLTAAVMKLAGV